MMVSFQAACQEFLIHLDTYRARERKTVIIFNAICLFFAVSLDVGLLVIIETESVQTKDEYCRYCKILTTLALILITAMIFLFLWHSLSTKMHLNYEKHRTKLFTSYFAVNLLMVCELLDSVLQDRTKSYAQDFTYLLSTMAIFIFLMAREPHDCF